MVRIVCGEALITGMVLCVLWYCLEVFYCVWWGSVYWFCIMFCGAVINGLVLCVMGQ